MFAAASAEKDSHPELLHLKYCKAALSSQQSSTQQSAVSTQHSAPKQFL